MRLVGQVESFAEPAEVAAAVLRCCRYCRSSFFAELARLADSYEQIYQECLEDGDLPSDYMPPPTWEDLCAQIVDDLDESENASLAAALAVLVVKCRE